jgi:hypothetical protein
MARYEHLSIYKPAMKTGLFFQTVVRKFNRYPSQNHAGFWEGGPGFRSFQFLSKIIENGCFVWQTEQGMDKIRFETDNLKTFRRYK